MRIIPTILVTLFVCTILAPSPLSALDETSLYRSVLQIRSYQYDASSGLYTLAAYGSSVSLGGGRLVTNAHVIFDDEAGEPYGRYEACESIVFERAPKCFSLAKLEAYDTDNDLALLSLDKKTTLQSVPLTLEKKYQIGSPLIIYGYPGIGGTTTTRTAGRIAGYDEPFYKIDGIIDRGNSGGGAFSLSGELIGIPSRLIVDNASLGYMIPVTTLRAFLSKKTPSYIRYTGSVDSDFRDYLTKKYSELVTSYRYKNSIVSLTNLRKYGLRFVKSHTTNMADSQVLLDLLYEKKQASVYLMCGKVASQTDAVLANWKKKVSTDLEVVLTQSSRFIMFREYVQKDQYAYTLFDTLSSCILVPAVPLSPTKDATFLLDIQRFFASDVATSLKTEPKGKFSGSLFGIDQVPVGMLVAELPEFGGQISTLIYLENSEKSTHLADVKVRTYDREKDLIDALFPYLDLDSDDKHISELSRLYKKDQSEGEYMLSGTTRTGNSFFLTYERADTPKNGKDYTNLSVIVLFTEKSGKVGYLEISWDEYAAWLDQNEITRVKTFLENITLRAQK